MTAASADFARRYGPFAVVAGASIGLGAAFAEALAARGLNLLLLARRQEPLEAHAAQLRARYPGLTIRTAALDLGRPDLAAAVAGLCADLEIGLLVYNAASATLGPFLDQPLDAAMGIIDVNCRGPVALCHLLGQAMARRGRGGILIMTSLAASQGTPYIAAYSATKAFDLVFAEALWGELRERGVDVLAVRAGAVRTPNYESSLPDGRDPAPVMTPAAVAESALRGLHHRAGPSMVAGWFNRFAAFAMGRLLPRRMAVEIMGRNTRRLVPTPVSARPSASTAYSGSSSDTGTDGGQ